MGCSYGERKGSGGRDDDSGYVVLRRRRQGLSGLGSGYGRHAGRRFGNGGYGTFWRRRSKLAGVEVDEAPASRTDELDMFKLMDPESEVLAKLYTLLWESITFVRGLWEDLGDTEEERSSFLLKFESMCCDVYGREINRTRELHQQLVQAKAEFRNLASVFGVLLKPEKVTGTLEEQMTFIKPGLEATRQKREERIKEFENVQLQIAFLSGEIAGDPILMKCTNVEIDESDLSVTKLGKLRSYFEVLSER